MPYRNGTKQEKLVQRCIEELGLRYVEQAKFGQYEVDFLLTELDVVVEADGPFGHLAKRDARRDQDLIDMGFTPGPDFTQVLFAAETQQLNGKFKSRQDALDFARGFAESRRDA